MIGGGRGGGGDGLKGRGWGLCSSEVVDINNVIVIQRTRAIKDRVVGPIVMLFVHHLLLLSYLSIDIDVLK